MSGQLSDFVGAAPARVADRLAPFASELGLSGGHGPKQLINAVLVALSADDLRPLTTFFALDPQKPGGIDNRLEVALRALEAVNRAAIAVARESLDPAACLELSVAAGEEMAQLVRRLSTHVLRAVAVQASSAASSTSAHGTSLSITMHELRRPLTILNSYGQLLSTGMLGQLPESAQVAIEGITSSTEQMIQMVSALAELSRLEDPDDQLTLEQIPLSEIVGAAYDQVSHEAALREITVKRNVAEELEVQGDRRRLSLAVTNILSNAVKHSPDNGTVSVDVFAGKRGEAHVVIRDEGPGFPPEDAVRLFEKYYRSAAERQRKTPGSGLGLYIVKTVAERHGGRVEARSQVGQGAEFEVVIPLRHTE